MTSTRLFFAVFAFVASLLVSSAAHAISLSTDVLNEGNPAPMNYNDGYNNNGTDSTVELVRFIPQSDADPLNATYNQAADTIDLAAFIVSGATAGNLGSNRHGRNSELFLPGDGESIPGGNNGGIGIGAHANWLITFDLDDIKTTFFGTDMEGSFRVTGRFGMNGEGSPGETVSPVGQVQGLIFLDGQLIDASPLRDVTDPSYPILEQFTGGRFLTFAIVNGDTATTFDDGTFRDLELTFSAVPEPGNCLLVGLGLAGFVCRRRRQAGQREGLGCQA